MNCLIDKNDSNYQDSVNYYVTKIHEDYIKNIYNSKLVKDYIKYKQGILLFGDCPSKHLPN